MKKLALALAIALPLSLAAAPANASVHPEVTASASVEGMRFIPMVTGRYCWFIPTCWNLGWGVPGGTSGVCYNC